MGSVNWRLILGVADQTSFNPSKQRSGWTLYVVIPLLLPLKRSSRAIGPASVAERLVQHVAVVARVAVKEAGDETEATFLQVRSPSDHLLVGEDGLN